MRNTLLGLSLLGLLAGGNAGCNSRGEKTPAQKAPAPKTPDPLAEVVSMMSGSFNSSEQAAADPDYFDIHLHMAPIWPDAPDGKWLYVEQARGDLLDKPYRQRVYHVTAQPDGSFLSDVYELPGDPLAYAGAWKDSSKLVGLTPTKVTRKDGCGVRLKITAPGVYEGGTEGNNCLSNLRGAAYAHSEVHMDSTGLRTWDRGYDAAGTQVWGAVKGGYHFKRQPN
jgi:CpeT protein